MTSKGMATTEFWVMLALQALTMVQVQLGAIAPTVAAWIAVALAGIYTLARAIVKYGETPDIQIQRDETTGGESGDSRSIAGKITPVLLACLLLLGGGMMTGCAQTETNRVAQSIVATTEQARVAKALHDAGVTTPAQEAVILTMIKAQAAAEDAYYAAIEAKDSPAMKAAKASWAAACVVTARELAKYTIKEPQINTNEHE